jgi:hypothetical protein
MYIQQASGPEPRRQLPDRQGFFSRQGEPQEHRRGYLALTPSGCAFRDAIMPVLMKRQARMRAYLTPGERKASPDCFCDWRPAHPTGPTITMMHLGEYNRPVDPAAALSGHAFKGAVHVSAR